MRVLVAGASGKTGTRVVAEVLVASLEVPATGDETVEVLSGGTPIREALEGL